MPPARGFDVRIALFRPREPCFDVVALGADEAQTLLVRYMYRYALTDASKSLAGLC